MRAIHCSCKCNKIFFSSPGIQIDIFQVFLKLQDHQCTYGGVAQSTKKLPSHFGHTLNLGPPCLAHLSAVGFLIYIPSNPIQLVNEGAILEISAESFDKTCAKLARQKMQVLAAVKHLLAPQRKTMNDDAELT